MAAEPDAFRQLNDAELAALARLGSRRSVAAGEYLYREGDVAAAVGEGSAAVRSVHAYPAFDRHAGSQRAAGAGRSRRIATATGNRSEEAVARFGK